MERFRKLQIIGLEGTHHGQSVSYACWISVDIQISSPHFLEKSLSKDSDGKCILNQSRYSKFYKKILTACQTTVGPLKYTVDICAGRPKKPWVWHWQQLRVKKIQMEKLSTGVCISKNINVPWQSHQITCRFKSLELCISPFQNTRYNFRITLWHVLML